MRTLVIGYGSSIRGDDGVGRTVAERVADDPRGQELRALSCAQLTPELAYELASAAEVVFVDATTETAAGVVETRPVTRAASGSMTHHLTPETLLGLAAALYGAAPRATLVSIGVETTEFGTELSEAVRAAVEVATERVFELVGAAVPG